MLDLDAFLELISEIEAQGYDAETAAHFASLIGDIPVSDEHGKILVMDGSRELARLNSLDIFS
jgi:hypothetical protein